MTPRRRRRRIRTLVKLAAAMMGVLILLVVVAPAAFIGVTCLGGGSAASRSSEIERVAEGVRGYFREEAATYLTVPEWYIVYSTEEYASFIRTMPPSRFPYFRAIRQYWRYYGHVCRVTRTAYPFSPGVHVMLGIIGASFSAENAVKGVYENTVGRATEWIGSHHTEEDTFAARTAREYGAFMHTVPWYEFPFADKLTALWRETRLWGPAIVRKWERKIVLSAEYAVKAAYAWVIRRGTGAVYGAEDLVIHAWVEAAPEGGFADRRVRTVKEIPPRSQVVVLPRYEPFTGIVTSLAKQGVRFRDIAGNDEIVLTAIVDRGWHYDLEAGELVFGEEILTNPGAKRIAVKAPVRSLHAVLTGLPHRGATVEHLYDY